MGKKHKKHKSEKHGYEGISFPHSPSNQPLELFADLNTLLKAPAIVSCVSTTITELIHHRAARLKLAAQADVTLHAYLPNSSVDIPQVLTNTRQAAMYYRSALAVSCNCTGNACQIS